MEVFCILFYNIFLMEGFKKYSEPHPSEKPEAQPPTVFPMIEIQSFLAQFKLKPLFDITLKWENASPVMKYDLQNLAYFIYINQGVGSTEVVPSTVQAAPNQWRLSEIKVALAPYGLESSKLESVAKAIQLATQGRADRQVILPEASQEVDPAVEGVVHELLNDLSVVMFDAPTNRGLTITAIFQGAREIALDLANDTNPLGLRPVEFHILPPSKQRELFGQDCFARVRVQPKFVEKKFEIGNGYGLVFQKLDLAGRRGFASYWVIFTTEDNIKQQVVQKNPHILMEVFGRRFPAFKELVLDQGVSLESTAPFILEE